MVAWHNNVQFMNTRMNNTIIGAAAVLAAVLAMSSNAAVTWPMEKLLTPPQTYDASAYATNGGVQVTFFEGLPYKGKPSRPACAAVRRSKQIRE